MIKKYKILNWLKSLLLNICCTVFHSRRLISRTLYRRRLSSPQAFIAQPLSPKAFIAQLLSPQAFIAEGFHRRRLSSPKAFIAAGFHRRRLSSPKAFILLSLFLIPPQSNSQNIDSLYDVFSASRGVAKIDVANEILNYCYENEYIVYLDTVKSSDDQSLVNAYIHAAMGGYYVWEKENYEKSNFFLQLALHHYEKNGNDTDVNLLNGNIGHNYSRMGDFQNAVLYLMKCYEYETKVGDYEGLSSTLTNLGVVYSQWQQPDMAIRFFEEAEKVERPLNRPYNYANRLASLAKEYMNIDAQKALTLIKEALTQAAKIERQDWKDERTAVHTASMGDIYSVLDSLKNAKKCYEQSLVFFEKNGRTYYVANTLLSLGRLQMKAKQYGEAIANLKKCENISEQNNYLPILRNACLYLGEVYNVIEPNTLAYFYHKKYSAINDTIFKEASQKQVNDFKVKYETFEKQLIIERQQTEILRQRTLKFILIGGLIALALLLSLAVYTVSLRTRRNRTLTEMNAMKDKFFSIISHDLKNPAVALRDRMQLFAKYVNRWNANELSENIDTSLNLSNRLLELLESLLNWAKIQTGREIYNPISFDLIVALQPDIQVVKSMAERKNIILQSQLPPEIIITGDENMIKIIVRNLLTNAVKFTPLGGEITINISPCPDDAQNISAKRYIVTVSDTGIGMSKEQIEKLFRLDSAHSRTGTAAEKGSGLGLIVCKELLKKHGSDLYIESEEGKGSKFWFELKM